MTGMLLAAQIPFFQHFLEVANFLQTSRHYIAYENNLSAFTKNSRFLNQYRFSAPFICRK